MSTTPEEGPYSFEAEVEAELRRATALQEAASTRQAEAVTAAVLAEAQRWTAQNREEQRRNAEYDRFNCFLSTEAAKTVEYLQGQGIPPNARFSWKNAAIYYRPRPEELSSRKALLGRFGLRHAVAGWVIAESGKITFSYGRVVGWGYGDPPSSNDRGVGSGCREIIPVFSGGAKVRKSGIALSTDGKLYYFHTKDHDTTRHTAPYELITEVSAKLALEHPSFVETNEELLEELDIRRQNWHPDLSKVSATANHLSSSDKTAAERDVDLADRRQWISVDIDDTQGVKLLLSRWHRAFVQLAARRGAPPPCENE
jgi:hypothetical protein